MTARRPNRLRVVQSRELVTYAEELQLGEDEPMVTIPLRRARELRLRLVPLPARPWWRRLRARLGR